MRNGNTQILMKLICLEIWVLILPMRNGNISKNYAMEILYNVLILPMRNGNKIRLGRY